MHSVCILIYVSMYLYSYLSTHGISGLAARGDWEQLEVRLKMTIELPQRYTPRPWSSNFGNALWGRDWANLEMHLEAVIDALGGRDWVNSEMHWETVIDVIERVWGCTLMPWLSEFGDAIRDRDWVNSEIHSKAVIERVWRCTCSRLWSSKIGGVLGGGRSGGGRWESRQVLRLY